MTSLILSIIVVLGLAGGPVDFGGSCGTNDPAPVVSAQ